jgi:hypothetical protein
LRTWAPTIRKKSRSGGGCPSQVPSARRHAPLPQRKNTESQTLAGPDITSTEAGFLKTKAPRPHLGMISPWVGLHPHASATAASAHTDFGVRAARTLKVLLQCHARDSPVAFIGRQMTPHTRYARAWNPRLERAAKAAPCQNTRRLHSLRRAGLPNPIILLVRRFRQMESEKNIALVNSQARLKNGHDSYRP